MSNCITNGVPFGREKKRADICIFDKDRPTVTVYFGGIEKTQTQGPQRTAQKLLPH